MMFSPNCSLPLPGGRIVVAPNVRGSFDIVWGCLSVLILCCWSILHLNVPPQFHPSTRTQTIRRLLLLFYLKVKWMIITFGAPETIMAKAIMDYTSARKFLKEFQKLAKHDNVEWSMAHTMFANMGGFVICFPPESRDNNAVSLLSKEVQPHDPQASFSQDIECGQVEGSVRGDEEDIQDDPGPQHLDPVGSFPTSLPNTTNSGLTTCQDNLEGRGHTQSGGKKSIEERCRDFSERYRERVESCNRLFGLSKWTPHKSHTRIVNEIFSTMTEEDLIDVHNLTPLSGNIWTLNAPQLLKARTYKIIDRLPSLTADELQDRNKSDALVKTIALIQCCWFVLQLLFRFSLHKPSSPLEVMTVAFFISSLITYSMLWNQPRDAMTPIYITASRGADRKDIKDLSKIGPSPFLETHEPPTAIPFNSYQPIRPNDRESSLFCVLLSSGMGSIIFGSIHLLAWNFAFPTDIERLLWIVASFITTLTPTIMIFVFLLEFLHTKKMPAFLSPTFLSIFFPALAIFVLARAFIFVEALRSIYFLPPGAFSSTWTADTVHLS